MAEVSTFRGIIEFFEKIGIYDVILPFLLVFTIVFAILEKTKVLGTEKIGDKEITKKNLNAMTAFVIGFLVIASSRLVQTITEVSSNVVVLLFLSVFFLLLIGSFYKEGEGVFLEKGGMRTLFMTIMFIGIIIIFLQAIKVKSGEGWLTWFIDYLNLNWNSTSVASIILIVVIVAFMIYIVKEPAIQEKQDKKSKKEE